jgi:hypothetical protein
MRFLLRSLPVGAGTCLVLTAACTTLHTVQPADLSPPNPPTRVWATRADHATVVVDYPRVSADSLIGMVSGWPERLPLSDATVLRVREPAPDRTAGLVFLGATGVLALAVYLVDKTPPGPFPCQAACPINDTPCCGG